MLFQKPYHHPYIPPNSLDVRQPPYVGGELAQLTSMTPFLRGEGQPIYENQSRPSRQAIRYGAVEYGEITLGLTSGSKGQSVRDLQTALGVTVDGKFGVNTKAALLQYQKMNGLAQTGTVDVTTLNSFSASPPSLETEEGGFDWSKVGGIFTDVVGGFAQGSTLPQVSEGLGTQQYAPQPQGMSTGTKIGLAVGGVVVVGLLVALVAKD